jgi:hypothetical protein
MLDSCNRLAYHGLWIFRLFVSRTLSHRRTVEHVCYVDIREKSEKAQLWRAESSATTTTS